MESEKREKSAAQNAPIRERLIPREGVSEDYVTRVFERPGDLPAETWNDLLAREANPSPFMRHEYLTALHDSGLSLIHI